MAIEFTFDPKTQRYRYTKGVGRGRFAPAEAIKSLTAKNINESKKDISQIAQLLVEQKISVATWEEETARALRYLHLSNYMLGVGGLKNMSQLDKDILTRRLNFQFQYLRGFSLDLIQSGMSESMFLARLNQYINAGRGSFEKGRETSHYKAGFRWEKRIRTKTESCLPCLNFASLGWQPIGTLPCPSELCDCGSQCGCTKSFSKDTLIPEDSNFGWLNQHLLMDHYG